MKRAFFVVVWVAAALNVLKGIPHVVHDLGFPYYVLNYGHGFMRRALFGTLFGAFVDGYSWQVQERTILAFHTLLSFTIWAGLLAWGLSLARAEKSERARAAILAGTAAFFLSNAPTTTTILAGYLDVVILALAATGAYLAHRGKLRAAGAVAFFGPPVHDAFVFLWAPVLLLAARRIARAPRDERRKRIIEALPLLAPLVSSVLTQVFASKAATRASLDALPVTEAVRRTFREQQFGMSIGDAFEYMLKKVTALPDQLVLAAAFFLPATIIVAACAASLDRSPSRWKRIGFSAAVALSPCSILFIAWDLSRFLVWSTYAALLLLFANARETETETERSRSPFPRALMTAVGALALLSTGPHVYAYFEVAYGDLGFAPPVMRYTPGARLTYTFLNVYNRKIASKPYSSKSKCEVTMHRATKVAGDSECAFDVEEHGFIETKDIWVSRGPWRIRGVVRPATTDCAKATKASISVWVPWRFMNVPPPLVVDVPESGGVIESHVAFNAEEAAMSRVRVGIEALDGCLRLDEITATQLP